MLTINTNLSSLIVQSNLRASTGGLNTAIERMTSGFKINHAKDNAANFSINTKLGSQLSSYHVAQDNVSMGLDMLTTAMDDLELINSHLSRIRDLSEQAANGTYSGNSLRAIQSEVAARLAEGQRIIQNSNYNGIQLFQAPEKEAESKFIEEVVRLSEDEALAQGYKIIKTADELQAMQDNLSGKYILMNDIDLSGYDWTAVGTSGNGFTGELNGNGFVISNLTINKPTEFYQGLFGYAYNYQADILNVGLENVNIVGSSYVAGLVGAGYIGNIKNCYVEGAIKGYNYVGGILGEGDVGGHDLMYCYSSGVIEGNDNVGGLIGYIKRHRKIYGCYSNANITGNMYVGGLAGYYAGSIHNSYSTGNITGVKNVGGLIGRIGIFYASDGVYNSYTLSKVAGTSNTGAIIGLINDLKFVSGDIVNSWYYSSINPTLSAVGLNEKTDFDINLFRDEVNVPVVVQPVLPNIITFQVGNNSEEYSTMSFDLEFTLDLSIEISDSESARKALSQIDELMQKINQRQTEFGSAYNRLESALESIAVSIDNLSSTQSTIRDADIAKESSAYIRNQILQQASATLLATANQTPAIALQLL